MVNLVIITKNLIQGQDFHLKLLMIIIKIQIMNYMKVNF